MTPTLESAPPAASRVIGRIKAEHLALARVIGAMQSWVTRAREPGDRADGVLFDAMLRYVEEVPDRFHHPQEDRHLFPAMAALPGAAGLVAALEREHVAGGAFLGAVRTAFVSFRSGAPNALNRLSDSIEEFAGFYWNHMRMEEEALLPIAARGLPESEWGRIEGVFEAVNDPLFASEPARRYRELYRFIAERTPAPLRAYIEEAARAPA